jgi:hypothetical protein
MPTVLRIDRFVLEHQRVVLRGEPAMYPNSAPIVARIAVITAILPANGSPNAPRARLRDRADRVRESDLRPYGGFLVFALPGKLRERMPSRS